MSDSEVFLADIDHLSDYGIRICQIGPQSICLEVVEKKDGSDFQSKSEQVIVSCGGLFRALTALEQDKIAREAERDGQSFAYDWRSLEIKEDQQATVKSGIRRKQSPNRKGVFVDNPGDIEGCNCTRNCELPCWQRPGLTDDPCDQCGCGASKND